MQSNLTADTLLSRRQVADALTAEGFPTPEKTLQTMACRGGGPPYRRYGKKCIYRWGDALAWAYSRLSKPVRSTSELRTAEAQGKGGRP
jgi:hypothetical protein